MKTLKNTVTKQIEQGKYEQAAHDFAEAVGLQFDCEFLRNGLHFHNDKDYRDIYRITLRKGKRVYAFDFGQSVYDSGFYFKEPTLYDVLACLQKYDVGTFKDFCSEFGYNDDSIQARKTYKEVKKEYNKILTLFSEQEIEILQEIQ